MSPFTRLMLIGTLCCALLAGLSGCGKKPSQLEPPAQPDFTAPATKQPKGDVKPSGKPRDVYPQLYPKPWL